MKRFEILDSGRVRVNLFAPKGQLEKVTRKRWYKEVWDSPYPGLEMAHQILMQLTVIRLGLLPREEALQISVLKIEEAVVGETGRPWSVCLVRVEEGDIVGWAGTIYQVREVTDNIVIMARQTESFANWMREALCEFAIGDISAYNRSMDRAIEALGESRELYTRPRPVEGLTLIYRAGEVILPGEGIPVW